MHGGEKYWQTVQEWTSNSDLMTSETELKSETNDTINMNYNDDGNDNDGVSGKFISDSSG